MDKGYGSEFDHPFKLLTENDSDSSITKADGHFAKMVLATGDETAKSLFEIALQKY